MVPSPVPRAVVDLGEVPIPAHQEVADLEEVPNQGHQRAGPNLDRQAGLVLDHRVEVVEAVPKEGHPNRRHRHHPAADPIRVPLPLPPPTLYYY